MIEELRVFEVGVDNIIDYDIMVSEYEYQSLNQMLTELANQEEQDHGF